MIQHQQVFWLTQRPAEGLWARYWCFPEATQAWHDALFNNFQRDIDAYHELPSFAHQLTHIHFTVHPVWVICDTRPPLATLDPHGAWFAPSDFASQALPKPVEKCMSALTGWQQAHHGQC